MLNAWYDIFVDSGKHITKCWSSLKGKKELLLINMSDTHEIVYALVPNTKGKSLWKQRKSIEMKDRWLELFLMLLYVSSAIPLWNLREAPQTCQCLLTYDEPASHMALFVFCLLPLFLTDYTRHHLDVGSPGSFYWLSLSRLVGIPVFHIGMYVKIILVHVWICLFLYQYTAVKARKADIGMAKLLSAGKVQSFFLAYFRAEKKKKKLW